MIFKPLLFPVLAACISLSTAQAEPPPEITKWCKDLSTDLQSVKMDKCTGYAWQLGASSEKNKIIPYLKWGKENGKKILILGAMHGDEITAVSLVFKWIDHMLSSSDDHICRQFSYMIAPLVNPDGYWVRPRTRTNANKVDLNRNFSTKAWNEQALVQWKKQTHSDPRRFPGKVAGSEKETKIVQQWIEEFKPELIISVHAPYGLIDHDGPVIFPQKKSPLKIHALGSFPGSLGQYAGVEKKIPVVTVELEAAKKLPEGKTIEELFDFVVNANPK